MFKKIIKYFKRIGNATAFALKETEEDILSQKSENSTPSIGIYKEIDDKRVAKHLRNGEVTQEVVELRYRDYKINREAKNYKYNGDGTARKIKTTEEEISRKTFIQDNNLITRGVYDELKDIEKSTIEEYTLKVEYNEIPRFKIESFCTHFEVSMPNKTIKLYFSGFRDNLNPKSQAFINELKRLCSIKTDSDKKHFETPNIITKFSFTTYKSIGEDDLVTYELNNLSFESCVEREKDFVITFSFIDITRDDVLTKYFSEEMEKKYQNKEAKKRYDDIVELNQKHYCSQCGKEINEIDARITKGSYGYELCPQCIIELDKLYGY